MGMDPAIIARHVHLRPLYQFKTVLEIAPQATPLVERGAKAVTTLAPNECTPDRLAKLGTFDLVLAHDIDAWQPLGRLVAPGGWLVVATRDASVHAQLKKTFASVETFHQQPLNAQLLAPVDDTGVAATVDLSALSQPPP